MNTGPAPRIGALASTLALLSGSAYAQQALPPLSEDHSIVWKVAFDRTRVRSASTFQVVLTDVYVMDSDGKNEKKLTASGLCHLPTWAPDGSKILFLCLKDASESAMPPDRDTPDQDIGVVASSGDAPHFLRPEIRIFGEPSWLPDAKAVAIENVRYNKTPNKFPVSERTTYTMALDGVGPPHRFLQDAAEVHWSPDGRKIAYVAYRGSKEKPAIYLADADGSGERPLTNPEIRAYSPSWSSNGSKIAFTELRGNRRTIFMATLQDSQIKALTPRKIDAFEPKWSPDGLRLTFSAIRDERIQIFLINVDGSGLRQLTNDKNTSCQHPSWSPDSAQIVFECRPFSSQSFMAISFVLFGSLHATAPASQLYLLNVNAPDATPIQLTHAGGSNPSFYPATGQSEISRK